MIELESVDLIYTCYFFPSNSIWNSGGFNAYQIKIIIKVMQKINITYTFSCMFI